MKYVASDDTSILYGKNYFIYRTEETDDRIDVFLKSASHNCHCPVCGAESSSLHATYERTIQDIPIRCKSTYVHAIVYKYNCENPQCRCKVFMEPLPFASASQVRTDALNILILSVAAYLSNEGASTVLSELGIMVSNDTIQRLLDRMVFRDDREMKEERLEDHADSIAKECTTSIYDVKDQHLIALPDGQDGTTMKVWMKRHKRIRLENRERARAYAIAIHTILQECTQRVDRIHLLQYLLDRMKEVFNKSQE